MNKHIFVLILFTTSLTSRLSAFPFASLSDYSFSIEPQAGFLMGRSDELVYSGEDSASLESELLWNFKPLWYFGTQLEIAQKNYARKFGLFTSLNIQFGLPLNTGSIMEDRDWLGSQGELTHYSRHENKTQNVFILDFFTGLDVPTPLGSLLTLRLSFGLSYMLFSFNAYDGYLRYGKWAGSSYLPLDDSDPKIPVNGSVISFSQDWISMPMGLSVFIFSGHVFSGELFFYSGPLLKYVGQDEHHLKTNTAQYAVYRDTISRGYLLQPGGEFVFSPFKKISFSLNFSWRKLAAPRGASSAAASGYLGDHTLRPLGNYAGASIRMIDFSFGLRIHL
jgi:outer membrane protease